MKNLFTLLNKLSFNYILREYARVIVPILVFILFSFVAKSQTSNCLNSDFELGNFTNWTGGTGTPFGTSGNVPGGCCPIVISTPGIIAPRQVIITGTPTDPNTFNSLVEVAPGSTFSARLGNWQIPNGNGGPFPGSKSESLSYTFTVTPNSVLFIYKYAVVLEDPITTKHTEAQRPRFEVSVEDSAGNFVPDSTCGFYQVAADSNNTGFLPGVSSPNSQVYYKNWTTVGIDLTAYMGRTLTILFQVGDCALGGHFAYAYIDAFCSPLQLTTKYCVGQSPVILTAPAGFTYLWSPGGMTTQSLVINNPQTGAAYSCQLTSVSGCIAAISTILQPTSVKANFGYNVKCNNVVSFFDSTTVQNGTIANYSWNFGDGTAIVNGFNNPVHTYSNPGIYNVTLISTSSVGCPDTASMQIVIQPPALLSLSGNENICPGQATALQITTPNVNNVTWSPAASLISINPTTVVASPAITTTYTVTANDSAGCILQNGIAIVRVLSPPTITVPATTICNGASTTLTANGGFTYVWGPAMGLSATTGSSVTANPSTNSTYTIIGTDINGCSSSATEMLTVNPKPTVTIPPASICAGASTTLAATGAVSYIWSPSTGLSTTANSSVTANPAVTTIYAVTGTDGSGCSASTNITVTVNPLPTIFVPSIATCTGTSTTLTANGASTYAWSPATTLSNPTGNSVVANPLINSTYVVTGVNVNGCSNTTNAIVTINPLPVITAPTATICNGQSASLTASGALTYAWLPATGLSNVTGSSVIANPTATTNYTIKGTAVNGCSNTTTVVVTVNPPPTVTVPSATICNGASAVLTAGGASAYTWAPATGLSATSGNSVSGNPPVTTIYTIVGKDISGCSNTTTATVTVNQPPTVTVPSAGICNGSGISLIANGALTYSWSPLAGLSKSTGNLVIANPLTTSTYTILGTNASGCSGTTTTIITVNSLPTIIVPPATVCKGQSALLTASGAVNYNWFPVNGLSAPTGKAVNANPLVSTTYSITGTDANGCTAITSTIVHINPSPSVTVPFATICNGSNTELTANGANIYTWAPLKGLSAGTGTTVMANPVTTTTYSIVGTSTSGCTGITTTTVTVNSLPGISVPPATLCKGQSANLTASGAVNYTWSPISGLSAATGNLVTANPIITTNYTIKGTDANGCSNSTTATVTVNPLPVVMAPSGTTTCSGISTTLKASGAMYYYWSPATGLNTTTGPVVIANPPATTNYVLVGEDKSGCIDTISVMVIVNANPVAAAKANANICIGSGTIINASGGNNYSWTPAGSLNFSNISNPYATPAQTTTYIAEVKNTNGCGATDTVVVYVHGKPVAEAGNDTMVCFGDSTLLHGSEGINYSWFPTDFLNNPQSSSPICIPKRSIIYTLTVTDSFGCSNQDSVQVFVKMPFNIQASPGASICSGGVVQLKATGGLSYLWTPPTGLDNPYAADPVASPDSTTTYTVTSSDSICFYASDTVVVTVNQLPFLNLSMNAIVTYGQNIQLMVYGNGNFTWSPPDFLTCTDCADPYVEHLNKSMTYVVTESSASGCRVEDTVRITLTCGDDALYIPDAFTPNGDNKNDIFRIRAYGMQHITYFRVFNRWGEMVFETKDINQGWDGTYKGQLCSPAVFDWYLEGTCSNGEDILRKGNVTLVR